MNETIIKTSVWKSVCLLLICLMFVVGGIFILFVGKNWRAFFIGLASFSFFGFGFVVLIRQTLDRRPRIIIDETGVTDRTLGVGKIDWDDIQASVLTAVFTNSFICLKISNVEKYVGKLSNTSKKMTKLNKSLGFGELNLNLSLVDMKPAKIQEIVMKHILANKHYGIPKERLGL
jgi:uncharacterized protein YjeT (DUF2065 family)